MKLKKYVKLPNIFRTVRIERILNLKPLKFGTLKIKYLYLNKHGSWKN